MRNLTYGFALDLEVAEVQKDPVSGPGVDKPVAHFRTRTCKHKKDAAADDDREKEI